MELVKSNGLQNLFDDIFSIEEVKIYKPSSKVYDMHVKQYSIKNEEVNGMDKGLCSYLCS